MYTQPCFRVDFPTVNLPLCMVLRNLLKWNESALTTISKCSKKFVIIYWILVTCYYITMLHVYNDIFQHVNWTRAEQWTTILLIIKVTTCSKILCTVLLFNQEGWDQLHPLPQASWRKFSITYFSADTGYIFS